MRTQTFYQPQNLGKGFGDWEKHTKVTLSFRLWLDTCYLLSSFVYPKCRFAQKGRGTDNVGIVCLILIYMYLFIIII